MKIKRLAAGVCALALCFGMTACGSTNGDSDSGSTKKEESTTTTEKREEIEMKDEQKEKVNEVAEQLDDTKLENTTVKFFSHWDINPADGGTVSPEIQMFRDKYDGKFEWIQTTWDARYDDLAALIMSKKSPDFFSAMDSDGFPRGAIKGMFEPVDDYIDLDSDLWKEAKVVNDNFVVGGKHYVAAIGAYPDCVLCYNTTTIKEKGYEDPATLYYEGNWTWSKFKDMCIDFADVDNDIAALDGWWYYKACNNVCGVPLVGLKDGKLVCNFSDPSVIKIQELMYDLEKNHVGFPRAKHGNQPRDNATTGAGLGTYETLFVPVGLWGIESEPANVTAFGDVEKGEVMFAPMPRLDDSDTTYMQARVDGYFLCKNAPNPEGFAAFMNCRMLAKKETEDIAVEQRKENYKWNDDMIAMRAECIKLANEHPVFDFQESISQEFTENISWGVASATMNTQADTMTWSEAIGQYELAANTMLDDLNKALEAAAAAE